MVLHSGGAVSSCARWTAVLDLLSPGIAPASLDLTELFHLTSAKCPTPDVQSNCM